MTIELNKFDLDTWEENTVTLIISDERHPIAENLCHKFLEKYHESHLTSDICVVFSQYCDYVDKQFHYDHYDHDILGKIISRQKKLRKTENMQSVLLLFDDDITSQKLAEDFMLKELIFTGIHYNITIVMRIPYEHTYEGNKMIHNIRYDPGIRSRLDYVIMYPSKKHEHVHVNVHLFYEQFFGDIGLESYMAMCMAMNESHALVYTYNKGITYL